jgi:hypothetical protein
MINIIRTPENTVEPHSRKPKERLFNIICCTRDGCRYILVYTDDSREMALEEVKKAVRNPDMHLSVSDAILISNEMYHLSKKYPGDTYSHTIKL